MANRYIGKKPIEHKRALAKLRAQRYRARVKHVFGKTGIPLRSA